MKSETNLFEPAKARPETSAALGDWPFLPRFSLAEPCTIRRSFRRPDFHGLMLVKPVIHALFPR